MVCQDLQLSAIVLYTCLTLCVVASGLITLRNRHSWAKNWYLEKLFQPNDLQSCNKQFFLSILKIWELGFGGKIA